VLGELLGSSGAHTLYILNFGVEPHDP